MANKHVSLSALNLKLFWPFKSPKHLIIQNLSSLALHFYKSLTWEVVLTIALLRKFKNTITSVSLLTSEYFLLFHLHLYVNCYMHTWQNTNLYYSVI